MFSCNCLNIGIEIIEKNEEITKEVLELTSQESAEIFFNQDQWYVGKLLNINKMYPGLIQTRQAGLWTITNCLNCEVQTHAIHREKGASYVLVNSKLLNQEAINNIKSNDLVSTIFNIIVNPNGNGPDNSALDTYHNRNRIKDFDDVITNYISQEQAAVDERIKKYSDQQYELLNALKDKAYKEREALVRIVQNIAKDNGTANDLSPIAFGNLSDKHSASNSPSEVLFSPKRPKSVTSDQEQPQNFREDLMFDFETDDFSGADNSFKNKNPDDSDSEDIEEAEDVVSEATGIKILQGRSAAGSGYNVAKSCPVDIPIFSQPTGNKNNRSGAGDRSDEFNRRPTQEFDIAASIKALARSVHGDAIFGELPRPKFSTQI